MTIAKHRPLVCQAGVCPALFFATESYPCLELTEQRYLEDRDTCSNLNKSHLSGRDDGLLVLHL